MDYHYCLTQKERGFSGQKESSGIMLGLEGVRGLVTSGPWLVYIVRKTINLFHPEEVRGSIPHR